MGRFSTTAGYAHADKVKAVYEHLGEIRKVADRLTPVENLVVFQTQIEDLHAQLTLLVEASETIVGMSEVGEALITGSLASIKTLLGIGELPPDVVLWSVLTPILEDLESRLGNGLGGVGNDIDEIRQGLLDLGHYVSSQQAIVQGLVTSYEGLQNGLSSAQDNLSVAISRLNVHEGRLTASDSRMDTITQNVTDALDGLTLANTAISGITSTIEILDDRVTLQNSAISTLSGQLIDLETGQVGLADAVDGIHTTLQGVNDDLLAQASRTTALSAAIGGNGNLLPNAGFEGGTGGWQIVHADGDWANSVLDVNSIGSMPAEVNALDVQGLPAPLGEIVVDSPYVLVEAGKHVIVSGYPCVDNGQITFGYRLYDNAGELVDQGVCPPAFNATTSGLFTDYNRTWVKFLVPAGAAKLRLYFRVYADGDFLSRAALFRPMVEHVWAEQEEPSTWVPNLSGVADGLANALATLRVEVQTNAQGIIALGEDLVQLTAEVADKAEASALSALTVRVEETEDGLEALSSDLTSLETVVDGKASAGAVSALETRVTDAEGDITSQATQISNLTASVGNANASITELSQVIASANTAIVLDPSFELNDGSWEFENGMTITTSGGGMTGNRFLDSVGPHASPRRAFNKGLFRVTPGGAWRVWIRCRYPAGTNKPGGFPSAGLQWFDENKNWITNTNIGDLSAGVTQVWKKFSGVVTAPAGAAYASMFIYGYNTGVNVGRWIYDDVGAESVTEGETVMLARHSLSLDVNGHIVGWVFNNDGTTGDFDLRADRFSVTDPSGTSGYTHAAGISIWRKNGYMTVIGPGFGAGNEFTYWYGPDFPNLSSCTRATGIRWDTITGVSYTRGAMFGGTLTAGGHTTALIATTYSTGPFSTNGGPIVVNASFSHSRQQLGGIIGGTRNNITAGSGTTACAIQLWRKVGTGAWTMVGSQSAVGTLNILTDPDPSVQVVATWNNTASLTYTDNEGGTQDRSFEVRVVTETYQGINISGSAPIPSPTNARQLGVLTAE